MTAQTESNNSMEINQARKINQLSKEVVRKKIKNFNPHYNENGKLIGISKKKEKRHELCLTDFNLTRFDFILDLIATGKSRREILQIFAKKFDLKLTTSSNYYVSAMRYIKDQNAADRDFIRDKYELMLMSLFQTAIENGNNSEAHRLMQTLIKLNGVSEPEKRETLTKFEFKFNTLTPPPNKPSDIKFDVEDVDFEEDNDG